MLLKAVKKSFITFTKRHLLLSDTAVVLFKVGLRTVVKNKFTLSAGTYSIDDFNEKVYVAVL